MQWKSIATAISGDPTGGATVLLSHLRQSSLPTESTISSLLKTLSLSPLHLPLGLQLHSLSLKLSLSSLPFPASSLISFYSKNRFPHNALKMFAEIPHPDSACFSALISALARNHLPSLALSLFRQMHSSPLPSSPHSISSAIAAAADMAALQQTRILHAHALASGLNTNSIVATALVVAYGKSGMACETQRAFDEIAAAGKANLVTYNALLAAHGQQGDAVSARRTFFEMCGHGLRPDEYTFLAMLAACGDSVEETGNWLGRMKGEYGVEPRLEHYTCLVGAMARAGRVLEAERFVGIMPVEADGAVWRMVLAGAAGCGDVGVGGRAAGRLMEMDGRDDSAYVLLGRVYGGAGRRGEMAGVWRRMRDEGVRKEGGRSWVEVGGGVHVFVAGDRMHRRSAEIYGMVGELERGGGVVAGEEEELEEGWWE